jgi:uncharacterized membrane protein SpoIIM required for sporulation
MKLAAFEAQGRPRWQRFAELLARLEQGESEGAAEMPALYRLVCNDLALARERALSGPLVAELNDLALRGHRLLYQARPVAWRSIGGFLARDFPRAVRREWRLVALCALAFYGVGLLLGLLTWNEPDLIYSFIDSETVAQMEAMYDPEGPVVSEERPAQDDVGMFGYYIWNNVSIAFRTFASGLAFGVGTLLSLVFNGLYLGLIASHLAREEAATPFFAFVIAHGAFELNAILLAGVAGLRLGLAALAPGARSRVAALREAARASLPVIAGAAAMLVVAAAVEAFWSPRVLPPPLKFGVGAALWVGVALWLGVAGRERAA